jgi:hypothetical protein
LNDEKDRTLTGSCPMVTVYRLDDLDELLRLGLLERL